MARIAVAQMRVTPGDIDANLSKALRLIADAATQDAELVLLPEMALAGVTEDGERLAQQIPGPVTERLCEAAADAGAWVIAGMPEANPEGKPFNVAVACSPSGEIAAVYRKVFLYLNEALGCARGDSACLLDLGFTTAGLTICYDYIFPEYIRALVMGGARLILHPTAWVDTKVCREWHYPASDAYRAQCMVRALENGVFIASANVIGNYDEGGYLGGVGRSAIIAPWGEVLAEVAEGEGVAVAECDFSRIEPWAEQVAPYLRDFRSTRIPEV
ncbi:MAG: carbon-nitrogen hydrolase family protein [candidate division WS1 bacterium]|nr:carbon-nitrogen hydrolase family protein [candidate division WS1 bacterium]